MTTQSPRRPLSGVPSTIAILIAGVLGVLPMAASVRQFMVPMRDGVHLATDVYLPEGDGPWPVVLLRFPYNKELARGVGPEANGKGYAFVAQDTRGRFGSEGDNLPFDADGDADGRRDGFDTATWVASQPWCDGRIGTWGGSAGAITQYLLAGTGQSNVVSQHLTVGSPGLFQESIYRGGIFRKAMVEEWLATTRFDANALDLWTTNYPHTRYWRDREITANYQRVRAAGLHIGGWHDIFARATIDAFLGYQHQGAPGARGRQKLIMGPWTHGILQETVGDAIYPGAKTTPDNRHDPWRWFAATLQGRPDPITDAPAVTYYTMGASGEDRAPGNEWRSAADWPPFRTSRSLHLHPDRGARFARPAGNGLITYQSDPSNPVPSIGGYELTLPAGPRDQRPIEGREDLVVFTGESLTDPLEITGDIKARFRISATVPDADLIVRLCDVYPDGRSMNVCEGATRISLRRGIDHRQLLDGSPVDVEILLWPTSMVFNRGHRLRVHVASSSAPALEPNLQNGQPPRTGSAQAGLITLHFEDGLPQLLLPVP